MDKRLQIEKLSPVLFWDIDRDQFDPEKHSAQLIQHVLECGELDDWRMVRDYYGLDRIATDCKGLRSLSPEALAFVCTMTDTKKEDYRCYNSTYYLQRKKNPYSDESDMAL